MTQDFTVWQLARMADCMDPDGVDSPGAKWLDLVASDASELAECSNESDLHDAISERADALVPIYTHDVWRVFVDLGAYREDPSDLGADASDMEQCAKVCLFMIAERLLAAVAEELADESDDDDDEDDE